VSDEVRQYPYRPRLTTIVFGGLFTGVGTLVLANRASRNDRGLVLNGLLEFSPESATVFYWVLTALFAAFLLIFLALAFVRITVPGRLLFGPTSMVLPTSRWTAGEMEIPYRQIESISETNVAGQHFLYVTYLGRKYAILESMLPSKRDFHEVIVVLRERAASAREPTPIMALRDFRGKQRGGEE